MRRHRRDELGASAVEYALLVGLIAVVCVAALVFVGGSSSEKVSVMGVHLERPTAGTSSNPLDFSAEPADVTDENYFGPGRIECAGRSGDSEGVGDGNNCPDADD